MQGFFPALFYSIALSVLMAVPPLLITVACKFKVDSSSFIPFQEVFGLSGPLASPYQFENWLFDFCAKDLEF